MSWMHCRSGCGAHRSTTVTSIAGEHIPECFVCHDPAYIDAWHWGRHGGGWVWGRNGDRKMECKDIPDATYLTAVSTAALLRDAKVALIWDVQFVLSSMPNYVGTNQFEIAEHMLVPYHLVRAKARKLIRKGLLEGCACGCRGDFEVVPGVETRGVVARDGTTRQVVVLR